MTMPIIVRERPFTSVYVMLWFLACVVGGIAQITQGVT